MPVPVLHLDVDGTVRPRSRDACRWSDLVVVHERPRPGRPVEELLLSPALGRALLALDVELRWATSWAHSADRCVGGHLGFPPLPVACAPNESFWNDEGPALRGQVEAERRPFVWVDDRAITPEWTAWAVSVAAEGVPDLLVRPDSASGLTPDDVDAIARWLRATAAAAPAPDDPPGSPVGPPR